MTRLINMKTCGEGCCRESAESDRTASRHGKKSKKSAGILPAHVAGNASPAALHDFFRLVLKWKWTGAITFVCVFSLTALFALCRAPVYRAFTVLEFGSENRKLINFSPPRASADHDYFTTQFELLKSLHLMEKVIADLTPVQKAKFYKENAGKWIPMDESTLEEQLYSLIFRSNVDSEVDWSVDEEHLASVMQSRLWVKILGKTRLVRCEIYSKDPNLARELLSVLVKVYLDETLAKRRSGSIEAGMWLKRELRRLHKEMISTRTALSEFKRQHGVVSLNKDVNDQIAAFTGFADNFRKATETRMKIQATLEEAVAGKIDVLPSTSIGDRVSALKFQLSQLETQYSEVVAVYSPEMPNAVLLARKRDELRRKIFEIEKDALSAALLSAQKQEKGLARAFEKAKSNAMGLNSIAADYVVLEKEVEIAEQLFAAFFKKSKEMEIEAGTIGNNVKVIISPSKPVAASSPKKGHLLLAGILISGIAGILATLVNEAINNKVNQPDDLENNTGLQVIGAVPRLAVKGFLSSERSLKRLLLSKSWSPFFDAVTNVGLLLRGVREETSNEVIAITSAVQAEGKTFFSVTLSLALSGEKRVLLVDCNLRTPKLHRFFDLPSRGAGLTSVLNGAGNNWKSVIQSTSIRNLDLMTSGPVPGNPSNLLRSDKIIEMIDNFRANYDVVILDCPSILGRSDSRTLANLADGVILVVKRGQASYGAIRQAAQSVVSAEGRIFGAVLNMAHSKP